MIFIEYKLEYDGESQHRIGKLLYLVLASSLLACLMIVLRHWLERRLFIMKYMNVGETPIFSNSVICSIVLECLLAMVHPYPPLTGHRFSYWNELIDANIYYTYNEILHTASLLRLVYFGFFLVTLSKYFSASAQRVRYSFLLTSDMYGSTKSPLIVLKTWMITKPMIAVSMILAISIALGAVTLQIIESPNSRIVQVMDHTSLFNCIWEVVLVMTTGRLFLNQVGYGEIYPLTYAGRTAVFFLSVGGVIVLSAMVVTVTNKLTMTPAQEKSCLVIERLWLDKKKKRLAVKLLDHWLWCCLLHKRDQLHLNPKLVCVIRSIAREFNKARR